MSNMYLDNQGQWQRKGWPTPANLMHFHSYVIPGTNPGWSPELNVKNQTFTPPAPAPQPTTPVQRNKHYEEFCQAAGITPAYLPAPEVQDVAVANLLDQVQKLSPSEQTKLVELILAGLRSQL